MYIERILCPIETLGPGRRLVIWTKGCSKKCPGCISPEMAIVGNANSISVEQLFTIIHNIYDEEGFDGITVSGGDPFEQLTELLQLLELIRTLTNDVLVYTGYVWEEFSKTINSSEKSKIENNISVLIDGPYVAEKNLSSLALRGSSNQNIIFFDSSKEDIYERYIREGRKLQNIYIDDKLLIVGIMDK